MNDIHLSLSIVQIISQTKKKTVMGASLSCSQVRDQDSSLRSLNSVVPLDGGGAPSAKTVLRDDLVESRETATSVDNTSAADKLTSTRNRLAPKMMLPAPPSPPQCLAIAIPATSPHAQSDSRNEISSAAHRRRQPSIVTTPSELVLEHRRFSHDALAPMLDSEAQTRASSVVGELPWRMVDDAFQESSHEMLVDLNAVSTASQQQQQQQQIPSNDRLVFLIENSIYPRCVEL